MPYESIELRYYNANLVVCPSRHAILAVKTEIQIEPIVVFGVEVPTYTHRYVAWRLASPKRKHKFRRRRELVSWMKTQVNDES